MDTPIQLFKRAIDSTRKSLIATPVEIALGMIDAVLIAATLDGVSVETEALIAQFVPASVLVLIAVFATSVLHRLGVIDSRKRWGLTGAYLTAGAFYGAFVFDHELIGEWWRFGLLAFALAASLLLVPLTAPRRTVDARTAVWRFSVRLLGRIVFAVAFSAILGLGLLLALGAGHELLGWDIGAEAIAYVSCLTTVGLGTWIVAAGLPSLTRIDRPVAKNTVAALRLLGTWLFAPLFALYLVILYLYGFKVLTSGEALSNVASPVALGAAILGLVGMLFAEPLGRGEQPSTISKLMQWFPLAYLPVIPLPVWAVWLRIEQHGWTEFRYVRLLAAGAMAVFCLVASYRLLRGRRPSVMTMPVVFGVAAFFAAFGPWGALNVSETSQRVRLKADLAHARDTEAKSRQAYLRSHFGDESLPSFPEPWAKEVVDIDKLD